MQRTRTLVITLLAVLSMGRSALAFDLPSVNLGFTSFLDGPAPAGTGFYFQQYVQYYTADRLLDENGNKIPFPDPELAALVSLSQVIYMGRTPCPLGTQWGLDVILPYVSLELDYAAAGPFPRANDAGFGDLLVGPFLQWDIVRNGKPLFFHRIEAQCILPTGDYDNGRELNPGANAFSFNPYWAGTLFAGPACTLSARLHYLWNATNDDAPLSSGGDEIQAGEAIHANFAAAYAVHPAVRLGINGYYLKQISDTEVDGHAVDGSREQVLGIGPGALVSFSKDTHLFLNVYLESGAENRPEGQRYNARFVKHF
jgi:hypothetical protein